MQNTTTTTRKTNQTNRKYKVCKENCSCDLYNNSLYVVNDADGACLSPTGKATFWKPELYSVVLEFELLRNLITTLILIWASLTSDYELFDFFKPTFPICSRELTNTTPHAGVS